MLYIIGHKKPDLDSAASAVALEQLFNQKEYFGYKEAQAVLADPANFETKTIFKKFNTSLPSVLKSENIKKEDRFILVDHNEKAQRLEGIKGKQIVDIFDHHKVSLNLEKPIYINTKPWGSSATIVYWWMEITGFKPDKNLAGLMISAILSDTVGLKSATTDDRDKQTVGKLNKIAQIADLDQLTQQIFSAKSSLKGLTKQQILTKDYKIYNFKNKKVFINQIETVEQDKIVKQSEEFLKELQKVKKELEVNIAFCLITDILKVNSKCLVLRVGEGILEKAFQPKKIKPGVYDLGAVMSRKKEIAPKIEKYVK